MKFTRRGLLQSLLALPFMRAAKTDARDLVVTTELTNVRTNADPVDFFDLVAHDQHITSSLGDGSFASMTTKAGVLTLGERVRIPLHWEGSEFIGVVVRITKDLRKGTDFVELEDDIAWQRRRNHVV